MAVLLAASTLIPAPFGAAAASAVTKKPAQTEAPRAARSAASPDRTTAAAPAKEARADPAAIAAKRDPQYTSATGTGAATDEGCLRQRKRLWVEGEGWLVRKVTVCP